MSEPRVAPYGTWQSPITIAMAVAASTALREPRLDGEDVYWTEGRPEERGRQVIVRWNRDEGARDVTPPPFNARTMAHEYGGGWYAVHEGTVYFTNLADGRIYVVARGGAPQALTAEARVRFADLVVDPAHQRLLGVREDHTALPEHAEAAEGERVPEPTSELVAVDLATGALTVLATGCDFYSTPRPSPDGRQLAWLSWRHPNMPWDESELWLADLDQSGQPVNERMVAGGSAVSIVQPEWAPDGSLVFVSDHSGWWNLYRLTDGAEPVAVLPLEAEFAGPQWVFGMSWYGIAADGSIVATAGDADGAAVWRIPPAGAPHKLDLPDTSIDSLRVAGSRACYLASSPTAPPAVVLLDLGSGKRTELRRSFELAVDRAYLALPSAIEFPTTEGHTAHALYYPPTNPDFSGPPDERPPLVVMVHGGPTSSVGSALSLSKQAFTSRGFAVVDVNYRGSNGYGREYMHLLDGNWGTYDVDDAVAAAEFLVRRGEADPQRMAIRGGSAGGFTTLAALVFKDVFATGASHFGVGDLEALARDTHKFESRYLDRMVAPYPAGLALYRERSPIHSVDQLNRPLIVFQGEDDMVVPIAQAEQIVDALRERHVPYAYFAFAGEGHGFRQAANIQRSLEAELSFYAQVFGFELADDFEPVEVQFLDEWQAGARLTPIPR